MKMLVAGAALATLVASPAFAQSYDPSLGTGNIVPNYSTTYTNSVAPHSHGAFARVVPGGAALSSPFARTPAFGYRWPGAKYDAYGYYIDPNSPGRW